MRLLYIELAVGLNLPSIESYLTTIEPSSLELASKNVPKNTVATNLLHGIIGDLWLALGGFKLITLFPIPLPSPPSIFFSLLLSISTLYSPHLSSTPCPSVCVCVCVCMNIHIHVNAYECASRLHVIMTTITRLKTLIK